eukprot:EW704390.1.p1 GENE.EW704390.1~~EW704390.1.p1  ORF type:complete len:136 (-),score=5.74 EW704390.1:69-476(-)
MCYCPHLRRPHTARTQHTQHMRTREHNTEGSPRRAAGRTDTARGKVSAAELRGRTSVRADPDGDERTGAKERAVEVALVCRRRPDRARERERRPNTHIRIQMRKQMRWRAVSADADSKSRWVCLSVSGAVTRAGS